MHQNQQPNIQHPEIWTGQKNLTSYQLFHLLARFSQTSEYIDLLGRNTSE